MCEPGQIGTGDTLTGLITLPGAQTTAAQGVYMQNTTAVLYGTKERRLKMLKEDVDIFLVNHDGINVIEADLLARDDIADIMVNGASTVFIEVGGKMQKTGVRFRDNAQLLNICQRIVSQVGRRVDEAGDEGEGSPGGRAATRVLQAHATHPDVSRRPQVRSRRPASADVEDAPHESAR